MNSEFGDIMQLGYIVADVKAVAAKWVESVDVGPFYILDSIAFDDYRYRGVRTELELCLGFAYWGSVQVELIQPLNTADTLYTRALKTAPGKLNHCATIVENIDELLNAHQLHDRVVHDGKMPTGVKFAYLEDYLPGGLHLELTQVQESSLQAFAGMQAIAKSWDGKRPLRAMSELGADLAALSKH